jgi:hypothetical protein
VPHGGRSTGAKLLRNPCIHAGSENPVVGYNATSGGAKSMEKHPISTVFLGFSTDFADFCPNLPDFGGF